MSIWMVGGTIGSIGGVPLDATQAVAPTKQNYGYMIDDSRGSVENRESRTPGS
jgi:hypothetical protein